MIHIFMSSLYMNRGGKVRGNRKVHFYPSAIRNSPSQTTSFPTYALPSIFAIPNRFWSLMSVIRITRVSPATTGFRNRTCRQHHEGRADMFQSRCKTTSTASTQLHFGHFQVSYFLKNTIFEGQGLGVRVGLSHQNARGGEVGCWQLPLTIRLMIIMIWLKNDALWGSPSLSLASYPWWYNHHVPL